MDDVGTDSEGTAGLWEASFRSEMQRLRVERGLTQADLAQQLRDRGLALHQQTVARIEAGQRSIRLNEALVIADALGSDINRMVTPEDERKAWRKMEDGRQALGRINTWAYRFVSTRWEIASLLDGEVTPKIRAAAEAWLGEHDADAAEHAARSGKATFDEDMAGYFRAKEQSDEDVRAYLRSKEQDDG